MCAAGKGWQRKSLLTVHRGVGVLGRLGRSDHTHATKSWIKNSILAALLGTGIALIAPVPARGRPGARLARPRPRCDLAPHAPPGGRGDPVRPFSIADRRISMGATAMIVVALVLGFFAAPRAAITH